MHLNCIKRYDIEFECTRVNIIIVLERQLTSTKTNKLVEKEKVAYFGTNKCFAFLIIYFGLYSDTEL